MNTPLRAALAMLSGATTLLVASCTSAPESALPPRGERHGFGVGEAVGVRFGVGITHERGY